MWVLQNLVQQSGDQHWAEQDLCSQWRHYIQGLYQPFNAVCSVRYQTATLNISNQSFCWLQWAIQEASCVSLPPPVQGTDAATTASSPSQGKAHLGHVWDPPKGHCHLPPFFLECSGYISAQRSNNCGKGTEKSCPCALTNPPDEHDLYLKTDRKEWEMQTSTQQMWTHQSTTATANLFVPLNF